MSDYEQNDPATFKRWFDPHGTWDAGRFRRYVDEREDARLDWRPKPGQISETHYVLIERSERRLCGHGVLRFPLNDEVEQTGGNLVVDVPPGLRRQGFGTLTLNRLLFEAVRAGLARALVTCAEDDEASRRMIEKNRGELESLENARARYWIRFR